MSHLAAPRLTVGQPKSELQKYPTVIALDPGGTTGWSVMQCRPEALSSPEVKILDNITHWAEGQVASESSDVKVESASPKRWEARKSIIRMAGPQFAFDASSECAAVHELIALIDAWPGCVVVTEDFILRQMNMARDLLAPVRIMAGLDYLLWKRGMVMYRQQPSEAKGAVTDARLKLWGFYSSSGAQRHARDATRHAITFLRKAKDLNMGPGRRALAWPHIYGEVTRRAKTPRSRTA